MEAMEDYVFSVSEVQDDGGGDFELLPVGDYTAQATKVGKTMTQADNGDWYYDVAFEIIDGAKKGRLVFGKFHLNNQNPKAVEISRREYARLHTAVGLAGSRNPVEVLNRPLIVKVGVEKGSNGFADKNQIKGYKALNGSAPAQQAQVQAQAPQAPAPQAPAPAQVPAQQAVIPEAQQAPLTTSAQVPAGEKKPWE